MKLVITAVATIVVNATPALASSGPETIGTGLLALLFLGFGALIVLCQLIPGVMLFFSMFKGLFDGAATKSIPRTDAKTS